MKRAAFIFITVLLLSAVLSGCQCKHEWKDAACETPKSCTICGETEGEALGHKWTDATCTESSHCSICGKPQGEALGHDWTEATCTSGKKCKRCDVMGGEPAGHTPGTWEMTDIDPVTAIADFQQKCANCGAVLAEEERASQILYNNGQFIFTPAEFSQRFANLVVTNQLPFEIGHSNPNYAKELFACYIAKDNERIAMMYLSDDLGNLIYSGQQTETGISNIMMIMSNTDFETFKQECKLLMVACDPSFDTFEALENAFGNFWDTVRDDKLYHLNGLTYEFLPAEDDTFVMTVGPATGNKSSF